MRAIQKLKYGTQNVHIKVDCIIFIFAREIQAAKTPNNSAAC